MWHISELSNVDDKFFVRIYALDEKMGHYPINYKECWIFVNTTNVVVPCITKINYIGWFEIFFDISRKYNFFFLFHMMIPCHAPLSVNKEWVFRIIHRGIAVATRLLVSFLEAPQVRVEIAMAWERLRQLKADLPHCFCSARWWAPGSDGRSISQSFRHTISSTISRRVCGFHPCGWPPSREQFFCRRVIQVSSLRGWKVSCFFFANKSIGRTLTTTNPALVDTVL